MGQGWDAEIACIYTVELAVAGLRPLGVPAGGGLIRRGFASPSPMPPQAGVYIFDGHVLF